MIVKEYIKNFEKLGFGLFVHYGIYSVLGKGEWVKEHNHLDADEYYKLAEQFAPAEDWADKLALAAKQAGCKYITLTTRHHDGYSLFDTCGLNTLDAPHSCGRDIVREFVDACRKHDLMPFFYHTLIDWHEETYKSDFKAYLKYLRKSVEILCTKYGQIGGFWFDGMVKRPNDDWEQDALYQLIRKYQPEAMIINNTGIRDQGKLGHIEIDSVTFERGKPRAINLEGSPKYVASEMCEIFANHWAYAKEDFNFKSPADLIRELVLCRRFGTNFLMNVGPTEDGSIRKLDAAMLELIGQWVAIHKEAIYEPSPSNIEVENKPDDFILVKGNTYYLFCNGLPMKANPDVEVQKDTSYKDIFSLDKQIKKITWVDNGESVGFEQEGNRVLVKTVPFQYGRQLVVRVARIETE